jgi:hypothetical protein
MSIEITSRFSTTMRTAQRYPELLSLNTLLRDLQHQQHGTRADDVQVPYYFIDDEVALQLLCVAYGERRGQPRGQPQLSRTALDGVDLTQLAWCALYPIPRPQLAKLAKIYNPGLRNTIVINTAPQPPVLGKVDAREAWQQAAITIYIGEQVLLFPATDRTGTDAPKEVTDLYLNGGMTGLLEAAGQPQVRTIFFNPRQRDLDGAHGDNALANILTGLFVK